MERYTNSYTELLEEVKKEIQNPELEDNEVCLVSYLQLPWFAGGQYVFYLIGDKDLIPQKLKVKFWDYQFDTTRFSTGVYNLDRLCIKAHIKVLSSEEIAQCISVLENINHLPETLEEKGAIVLDGADYELDLNTKKHQKQYKWRIETEDIVIFEPLIAFVKFMDLERQY